MINWLRSIIVRRKAPASSQAARLLLDPIYSAVYAIGDVHGCYKELLSLEEKILSDARGIEGAKLVVMLGDYIDRGPASAAVIEHLLKPLAEGMDRICLLGNHEQMFLKFWATPTEKSDWLKLGGEETLSSYGVYLDENHRQPMISQLRATVPQEHLDFLANLPVLLRIGNCCFVHAGIDPSVPFDEQSDEVLLTSRPQQFDWSAYRSHLTVIHGHTPVKSIDLSAQRINLDIQAYRSGRLAALKIQGDQLDLIFSG